MIMFPTEYIRMGARFQLTPSAIDRYRKKTLNRLLQFTARKAPFYRDLALESSPFLENFPILDKKEFMENLSWINTRGFEGKALMDFCIAREKDRNFRRRFRGCTAALSSGTSGNRGIELVSPREEAWMGALYLSRIPFPRGKKNVAFILRISSPALNQNIAGNRLAYINPYQPKEGIVEALNSQSPNILAAQPSLLRVLAREQRAGRLHLRLKMLVGYAEIFPIEEKQALEGIFQCEVHEIYKSTEGAIAQTCSHKRLHINEDAVFLELAPTGSLPEASAPQKIILTNLHRTTLPVIRFQLNDLIELDPEPCPCGSSFRVISRVLGRADDLLWFLSSPERKMQYILPDYFRRILLCLSPDIEEYRIVQTAPDQVNILLQTEGEGDWNTLIRRGEALFQELFEQHACLPPTLNWERGIIEKNPQSLKLIRIQRRFDDDSIPQY